MDNQQTTENINQSNQSAPTTYKFNQDGSVDIPVNGVQTRFVKESDLLKVKASRDDTLKGLEIEKSKFQADLDEANKQREELHKQVLQAQADREKLSEQYKDYDDHKNKVNELTKELNTHKEKITNYENELMDRIKQSLISFGASEDVVKDKSLEQLKNLEEAAKIFGSQSPKPANYDTGKVGGGTGPESPIDRAIRILQENDDKGRRIGSRQVKVS